MTEIKDFLESDTKKIKKEIKVRKSCKTCRLSVNGMPGRCDSRKCLNSPTRICWKPFLSTYLKDKKDKKDTKDTDSIAPYQACEFCIFGPQEKCQRVCIDGDCFEAKKNTEILNKEKPLDKGDTNNTSSYLCVFGDSFEAKKSAEIMKKKKLLDKEVSLSKESKESKEATIEYNVDDIRSYNIGNSDYAKHKIQPWHIWEEYALNPWEADIIKRVLRKKKGCSRKTDLEKIIHVTKELIRQELIKEEAIRHGPKDEGK